MTNFRTTFCNEPEDVQWLKAVHLRHLDPIEFASFVMNGNEDAPESVVLYAQAQPTVFDTPARTLVQGADGRLC